MGKCKQAWHKLDKKMLHVLLALVITIGAIVLMLNAGVNAAKTLSNVFLADDTAADDTTRDGSDGDYTNAGTDYPDNANYVYPATTNTEIDGNYYYDKNQVYPENTNTGTDTTKDYDEKAYPYDKTQVTDPAVKTDPNNTYDYKSYDYKTTTT
ncbi:MAG: hypothetical protein WC285_01815, partial [Candidatus Gracilibacteria bacterium]